MISDFVERRPALALLGVASLLGMAPIGLVVAGLLPTGFSQLGALSASMAGLVLAAVEGGRGRVTELLRRGLIWRVGGRWWFIAISYTAGLAIAALVVASSVRGDGIDTSDFGSLARVVPMMVVLIIFAGFGEEFGWRGFLVPRLQARHSALRASLIVGVCHSAWHIPLFFVNGTAQNGWAGELGLVTALLGYSLFVTAWAVHLSWIFNNTRGSVLLVAVAHGAGNAWIGGYFDVSGNGGVGGIVALSGLTALLAILIVGVSGAAHLSRDVERDAGTTHGESGQR